MDRSSTLGKTLYGVPRKILKGVMHNVSYEHVKKHEYLISFLDSFFWHYKSRYSLPCLVFSEEVIQYYRKCFSTYKKVITAQEDSLEFIYFDDDYDDSDGDPVHREGLFIFRNDDGLYYLLGIQMSLTTGYWLNKSILNKAYEFLCTNNISRDISPNNLLSDGHINCSQIVYVD